MSIIRKEPWLVPEAVVFLSQLKMEKFKVLETGSGGSTLWFGRRCAGVVSYEHSPRWYARIKALIEEEGLTNVCLVLDPDYPEKGFSGFPPECFDLILVDGRGRVKTIETTIGLLKRGGYMVLDNSDRTKARQYGPGIALLTGLGWDRREFAATRLHKAKAWRTAIWRKP